MLQLSRRAVAPVHGAAYAGEITRVVHSMGKTFKSQLPISFKVSANGKSVGDFTFTKFYPVYCQGGGFGSPHSKSGKISATGKFKVKLPLIFAPSHAHEGFLVVSGTFAKHGKVSGTAFTDFTKATTCNGTAKYTGKAG